MTEQYQAQKLYEEPGIHRTGIMNSQAFHVDLILQIVEAILHNLFGPIYAKCFSRVLDLIR